MKKIKLGRIILYLSLPLAVLITLTSSIGLFSNYFYSAETLNWKTQATGQDIVDLFLIVPLLLLSAILFWSGRRISLGIWGGVILYLVYTYTIYAFAIHFNFLFAIYCIVLGISTYAFLFLFINISRRNEINVTVSVPFKLAANYFVVISLAFYMLWIIQILPSSIQNKIPKEVSSIGLLTNPVHAIDLSVCLPGIFLTGILILKKKPLGFFMAPMVMTFMVLMNITIGLLTILMKKKGINN